ACRLHVRLVVGHEREGRDAVRLMAAGAARLQDGRDVAVVGQRRRVVVVAGGRLTAAARDQDERQELPHEACLEATPGPIVTSWNYFVRVRGFSTSVGFSHTHAACPST